MGKLERLRTKVFLFIIVSGLINFYVLSKLFTLFGVEKNGWFVAACIFASISYILAAELLRIFNNDFIKAISGVFATWLGISFIFLWSFAIYDIANLITPINFHIAGYIIFLSDLIIISYSIYNATTFSVRTVRIESDKIDNSFKIVQLSDLHIGAAHKADFLPKTVKRVNELNPDFVVITGDLMDGVHPYRGNEFSCLKDISSPVFFSLGNHEKFIDIDKVYSLLKDSNVTFLRNQSITHNGLEIIGVDDFTTKKEFMEHFSKIKVSDDKFSILLYHRPVVYEEVSEKNIDLMLSGHTHAGQLFPLNIIMSIIDGPVAGIHRKNNTILYVSNGTGWWGPPMRLGSRNEITIIELISTKAIIIDNNGKAAPLNSLAMDLSDLLNKEPLTTTKTKNNSEAKDEKKRIKAASNKKLTKKAEIISLNRGSDAIEASREEDAIIKKLNHYLPNKASKVNLKIVTKQKNKTKKTK